MSRQNERKYELVDVDVSIVSLDYENAETADVAPVDVTEQPPPTLPTGQVIDSKNTLQPFESSTPPNVPATPKEVAAPDGAGGGVHPTLPDGQVITGKNTLQSFDIAREREPPAIPSQRTPLDPPDDGDDGAVKRRSSHPPPLAAPFSSAIMAVAVETDDVVYAELAIEPTANENAAQPVAAAASPPVTPWYKARSTFVLLTIISVLIAVVLGVSIIYSNSKNNSTLSPTSAPVAIDPNFEIRANILTSYINNISLSNQTKIPNGLTPENKALEWLIYNDTAIDTMAVINQSNPIARNAIGFRIRQRYPLLVMWFQQTETTQWAITTGWLDDASECAWEGITCETRLVDYYIDYRGIGKGGSHNAITQISFKLLSSYTGPIPVEIGLLSTLEHFEIANTYGNGIENGRYLFGTLPESIGQWTRLTHFDVLGNGLTGTLPDSIGQWTALTYFDVSDNGLNGPLPNSIGQWFALTYFDVGANDVTRILPDSIGQWTGLTHFDVLGNDLTGTLPDSIGQWTALTYFDVSDNILNGTLPDSIGRWTALNYFNVGYNACLNGTLPDSIGQWTALTYFDVSLDFGLNGTLPESIGQWTALTYFDLLVNAFTGTIPVSIGNWSLIRSADFSGNQFVGTLPDAICRYIEPDMYEPLSVDCAVNCTCCTDFCVIVTRPQSWICSEGTHSRS